MADSTTEQAKISLQHNTQIRRGMYVKQVKWIPVVYWCIPDSNVFCNMYIKLQNWVPMILNRMLKKFEEEEQKKYSSEELTENKMLEITLKSWRKAQEMWNFVWDTAIELSKEWQNPFVIRFREMDEDKIND